jgi:RNA polymerase sigma-70 factor (ECF subfamily)
MDELAQRFEENRAHLRAVAYRMLGSRTEAEDAVQEAWLRLSRSDSSGVANLGGWLTTVVARVCLDMLRARKSRHEAPLEDAPVQKLESESGFERDAELADGVGLALMVVLDTLAPAERVAFVLHDMFDLSFDEIAPILGRSSAATRQLASRARRRVQGSPAKPDADHTRHREIVAAFLAASRGGDFSGLLAVLDPDVVLRADTFAVQAAAAAASKGAPHLAAEVRGAAAVADVFRGRAQAARLAMVDGAPGAVFAPGGKPRSAFAFAIEGGKIAGISVIADPETLRELDIAILGE